MAEEVKGQIDTKQMYAYLSQTQQEVDLSWTPTKIYPQPGDFQCQVWSSFNWNKTTSSLSTLQVKVCFNGTGIGNQQRRLVPQFQSQQDSRHFRGDLDGIH